MVEHREPKLAEAVAAGTLDPGGLPNPLGKEVVQQAGAVVQQAGSLLRRADRLLPELRFTRTYWLMSHPDTHDTRRVAEGYAAITRAVQEAKGSFVLSP